MTMTEVRRTALAKWMFKTGTSGRDLAKKAGTSEPTISRLKNGEPITVDESVRQRILSITGLRKLD